MKNILIIEDGIDLAELVGEVLKDSEYDVTIFHDGDQALDYLTSNNPDLIILDMILPQKSGVEIYSELNDRLNKQIPIIFISASTSIGKILSNKQSSITYFLPKPFDYVVLIKLIEHYFEQGSFQSFDESA